MAWPLMWGKCRKLGYWTEAEALRALNHIADERGKGRARRRERRAYKCPSCHRWHLTSRRPHMHRRHG